MILHGDGLGKRYYSTGGWKPAPVAPGTIQPGTVIEWRATIYRFTVTSALYASDTLIGLVRNALENKGYLLHEIQQINGWTGKEIRIVATVPRTSQLNDFRQFFTDVCKENGIVMSDAENKIAVVRLSGNTPPARNTPRNTTPTQSGGGAASTVESWLPSISPAAGVIGATASQGVLSAFGLTGTTILLGGAVLIGIIMLKD
jgi:hypothetical protein